MSQRIEFSKEHYAAKWPLPAECDHYDRKAVNILGLAFAGMEPGPDKDAAGLELVKCFHPYLMKYLFMICRGHLPDMHSAMGRDCAEFLRLGIKKGNREDSVALLDECRKLHLAFKQETSDDVYDVLVVCLWRALCHYDPSYTGKVKAVCEAIKHGHLAKEKLLNIGAVSDVVGFDSLGCLRLLASKEFLVSIKGKKNEVIGYQRTMAWPPPESFHESGPIGLAYFLQKWFRLYLRQYIEEALGTFECHEDVMQLDNLVVVTTTGGGLDVNSAGRIPDANGTEDSKGLRWKVDEGLTRLVLDVSVMDLEWVNQTADSLFHGLTREQRYLLFLVHVRGLSWKEIGETWGYTRKTARRVAQDMYTAVMKQIRESADLPEILTEVQVNQSL